MKKLLSLFAILICLAILFYPKPSTSNTAGSIGGQTGSPTDGVSCTQCHYAGSGTGATITTNIPSTGYVPGTTYTITATVAQTGINKFGFEITSEKNAGGAKTGTFFVTNSTQTKLVNSNTAITHKSAGTSGTNNKSWSMDWQAPTSGTGAITFYGAYIAANGNGQNTGDTYHSASSTFNEFICNTSAIQTMTGFNPNPVYSAADFSYDTLTFTNTSNCAINVRPEFTISKTNGVISQGDINLKFMNPLNGNWTNIPYSIAANGNAVGSLGYPITDTTGIEIGQGASLPPVIVRVNFTPGTQGNYCATWLTKEVDTLGNVIQILTSASAACLDFVNCNTFSVDSSFSSDITCFNANDGNASILSIQNGSGNYQYIWSNGGITNSITNLAPGSYYCYIIDQDWEQCYDSLGFLIAEPSEINITLTPTDLTTTGANDGIVTSLVIGGLPPYIYDWTGPNGYTNAGGPIDINGLASGIYTLNVTDSANCQQSMIAPINDPGCAIVITEIASVQLACNGDSADWQWTNSGGVLPYSNTVVNSLGSVVYTLSGSSGSALLTAGTYTVLVTDSVGCSSLLNTAITEPTLLTTTTSFINVSCFGGSDGTATANPSGGTAPYTYLWSNGQTTQTATNLLAGTYTCAITDSNSCSAINSATVNEPSPLLINVNINGASLVATSGFVTYQWYTASGTPIAGATSEIFNPSSMGGYYVVVTDGNCEDTSSTINYTISGLSNPNQSIKIYPNPTNGLLTIEGANASHNITVMTFIGNQLLKVENNSNNGGLTKLDLSTFARGIYFIQIEQKNQIMNYRIVLQ